jgi:hypothetical protein
MTESLCDVVAERMALGEPLAELSEHVSSCDSCQGLVAVSNKLGATHHAVDPGLGFSARMTVGAQHLLGVRRRRRLAVGLAATVATGMFGVFVVARTPEPPGTESPRAVIAPPHTPEQEPSKDAPDSTDEPDADLAALAGLADTERSMHLSAPWGHIKKPLSPYKKLLKGVVP